jgi:hypothetical protein
MTDYRPNDPLDPMNPQSDRYLDEPGPGASWGWIVGGLVALFLVFVFVFGFSGGDRTASTDTQRPATQTSTAPPRTTPAPAPTAQSPAPAQENTGAAPRDTNTGTRQ